MFSSYIFIALIFIEHVSFIFPTQYMDLAAIDFTCFVCLDIVFSMSNVLVCV